MEPRMMLERAQKQVDDLKALKDDWYAPGCGEAYDLSDLCWLEGRIGFFSEPIQSQIFIYPNVGNEVVMEWRVGSIDISFEVNFKTRKGYWHWLDLCGDLSYGVEFNIDEDEIWNKVDSMIREFMSKNDPSLLQ